MMKKQTKRVGSTPKRTIPAAVAKTQRASLPRMQSKNGIVTISRKEMVGTVSNGTVTTGFYLTPQSQTIPGYDASITCGIMFPWGSVVGSAYEKYRFKRLSVELISAQPSTAAGRVYVGFDPDYSDNVPVSKARLMGLACSVDASVWETVRLSIPPSVMNSSIEWRFCSPDTRTAESEPRTAFAGFFVFGIDSPTANCIWDLWVDYEVDLMTPTSENLGPAYAQTDVAGSVIVASTLPGFGGIYLPQLSSNSAPLEIVTPEMAHVTSTLGGQPVKSVLKLPVSGPVSGVASCTFDMHTAGVTPASLLTANNVWSDANVYDSLGTLLGNLEQLNNNPLFGGPANPSEAILANAPTKFGWSLPVKTIKEKWPTASSLLPFLQAAAPMALDYLRTTAMMAL